MSGIVQYLKETQGELRHVAWPTRAQTIVYTILVAFISIGVALYLGLFDYLFTTGLARLVSVLPAANPIQVTETTTIPAEPVTPATPLDTTGLPQTKTQ